MFVGVVGGKGGRRVEEKHHCDTLVDRVCHTKILRILFQWRNSPVQLLLDIIHVSVTVALMCTKLVSISIVVVFFVLFCFLFVCLFCFLFVCLFLENGGLGHYQVLVNFM